MIGNIVLPFLAWYFTVQLVSIAATPLTLRAFRALPDRGYAFARVLGIFLVSLLLWLGTSYGLLRNSAGGAWLALILVASMSVWVFRHHSGHEGGGLLSRLHRAIRWSSSWKYVLRVEILFLVSFAAWTYVRAYDPAISHTEQPMDLMFINGIWSSPTYPPRDPWLSGHAISYYYFGYWMISTLAHISAQPPEIAYNVGQACWFGLLVTSSFGIGYNLFCLASREEDVTADSRVQTGSSEDGEKTGRVKGFLPLAAGLLTSTAVALTSNLHVILEWLYAHGVGMQGLIRLVDVYNFPAGATVSGLWYIDSGWTWWWRASRVIEDVDLNGNHIEVIDEFPIFSYVLSDNHPHLLAMPFVILVISIALSWFIGGGKGRVGEAESGGSGAEEKKGLASLTLDWLVTQYQIISRSTGPARLLLIIAATGSLLFLNTWDFPPYWLLMMVAALFTYGARNEEASAALGSATARACLVGLIILVGAILLYLPYFVTAQSQAGGISPNLLHPTKFPQFFLMFGHFLLAGIGLLIVSWREQRPSATVLLSTMVFVLGVPVTFLVATAVLKGISPSGTVAVGDQVRPFLDVFMERRLEQPWTFLLVGAMISVSLGLLWQRFQEPGRANRATTFVLCLFAIGLLLTFMPEFVYLQDNFGTRMNTVFKFYYQGWLLLGVSAAYAIFMYVKTASARVRQGVNLPGKTARIEDILPAVSLLLILLCLVFPVAGAYAKIKGFGTREPTLNGLAYVGEDELAVVDWIRRNTSPEAVILEAKGASYNSGTARISASTGRATLLGWDGHEAQWRGRAYGEMAAGRDEAISEVYLRPRPSTLRETIRRWDIDYVLIGPTERARFGMTPALEERLNQALELAFEQGNFRIYRAEGAGD